jgi:8-amino-7-oxononanoate synthase
VGDRAQNFIFWRRLTDAGLFVSPFTKPAAEHELVRSVFMATHTDEQVTRALEIFQRCGREVGIIPYERPHTRAEVKMARPGATGFLSSAEEGGAVVSTATGAKFGLAAILGNRGEPVAQRFSEAAELLTWRALNVGGDDVLRLTQLPERLWTQRHRIRSKLMAMGMNWVSQRQGRRHRDDSTQGETGS